MSFSVPALQEIQQRVIVDIINSYNISSNVDEHIDPSLRNNPEGAFAYALAQQSDSSNKLANRIVKNLDPQTAEEEFLKRLAVLVGLFINPATISTGFMIFLGTIGTTIASGTSLTKTDGTLYTTKASGITANQIISVSSLTRSGTTATGTTASAHTLGAGMDVDITGANETDYNGTFTILSIPSATTFTYTVSGTPATPATGTILADYDGVSIEIESDDTGVDSNISSGGTLNLATPIGGIDNVIYTQFAGISGGADEEDLEDFRSRVVEKWQNPAPPFSALDIKALAKTISGVTRVWVDEATPLAGQSTTYFVRDDDDSIIPDSGEILTVKTLLLTRKTAHTSDNDVIVSAPTPVVIPITFTSLSPNTDEMQSAIIASLQEFFTSENDVGEDVELNQITNAIFNTIDDTGVQPTFALSAPAADTTINAGEIGTLGTITWP